MDVHVSNRIVLQGYCWMNRQMITSFNSSAHCDGNFVFSPTSGNICECTQQGVTSCTLIEEQGCYCEEGFYTNDQAICVPNSECKREWINAISLSQQIHMVYTDHNVILIWSLATCVGGTSNTPAGSTISECTGGGIQNRQTDADGCYCPSNQFLNELGVCTPNGGCNCELSNRSGRMVFAME